jgi:hypothetical protein
MVLANLVQEAALVQGVEQPEAHAFGEAGPDDHVPQAQHVSRRLERFDHAGRVDQRFYDVPAVVGSLHVAPLADSFISFDM